MLQQNNRHHSVVWKGRTQINPGIFVERELSGPRGPIKGGVGWLIRSATTKQSEAQPENDGCTNHESGSHGPILFPFSAQRELRRPVAVIDFQPCMVSQLQPRTHGSHASRVGVSAGRGCAPAREVATEEVQRTASVGSCIHQRANRGCIREEQEAHESASGESAGFARAKGAPFQDRNIRTSIPHAVVGDEFIPLDALNHEPLTPSILHLHGNRIPHLYLPERGICRCGRERNRAHARATRRSEHHSSKSNDDYPRERTPRFVHILFIGHTDWRCRPVVIMAPGTQRCVSASSRSSSTRMSGGVCKERPPRTRWPSDHSSPVRRRTVDGLDGALMTRNSTHSTRSTEARHDERHGDTEPRPINARPSCRHFTPPKKGSVAATSPERQTERERARPASVGRLGYGCCNS